MAEKIVIRANARKRLPVELVGTDYRVKPPKMGVLAAILKTVSEKQAKEQGADILKHMDNLVKIMFGPAATKVLARLADPEDDLDYQEIMDAAEAVMEAQDPENPST
jgi:hypothetical protein